MNSVSCCSSCTGTNVDTLFSMGDYIAPQVGYSQTYSFPKATERGVKTLGAYPSSTRPTGITPLGMAGECLGEPVPRPCNYETATLGAYNRGNGNPDPMYSTNGYANTGNPNVWRPMNGYANTGNPTVWSPMSGLNSVGRQARTGFPDRVNPLGRQARTGFPDRVNPIGTFAGSGNGGSMVAKMGSGMEQIGTRPLSGVQPMGFLWPLVAGVVGLGAVAGATWWANNTTDAILQPDVAGIVGEPIVKTTGNIATVAVVGLIGYLFLRKDIEKFIK